VAAFQLNRPALTGNTFLADLTAEISVTDDNTIQCDTTDTTDTQVLVIWATDEI
jgi:hypothetical protein